MSRCFSEIEIARYLEGDLNRKWMTRADMHLQSCASCHELAEDFRQTQQRLKEHWPPVISEGMTSLMRRQVIDQIRSLDVTSRWQRTVEVALFQTSRLRYAGITTVVILLAAVWLWPVRNVQQSTLTVSEDNSRMMPSTDVQVAKAALPVQAMKPEPAPGRRTTKQPRPDAETSTEVQQITVKLLTDDPDVVIYWVLDANGGQQL